MPISLAQSTPFENINPKSLIGASQNLTKVVIGDGTWVEPGSGDSQTPYLFQISENTGAHHHVTSLSIAQAKSLIANPGTTVSIITNQIDGHDHTVTIGYDFDLADFIIVSIINNVSSDTATSSALNSPNHHGLLVGKTTGGFRTMSYADALAIYTNKGATKFVKGSLYQITKRVLQGTGTTGYVVVAAVSDYELSSSGQFHVAVPDYINGKVWSKATDAQEVIHLGKTWTFKTDGALTDEPMAVSTSWGIKTGTGVDTNGNSLYEWDEVLYTLSNDWIGERKDKRGNVISMSIAGGNDYGYTYPATIDQFAWGHISIFGNHISDSLLSEVFLRGAVSPYVSNNNINETNLVGVIGQINPTDPTIVTGLDMELCTLNYAYIINTTGYFTSVIMTNNRLFNSNFSRCSDSVLTGGSINGLGMPLFPCTFSGNNLTDANISSAIPPTRRTNFTGIVATDNLYMGLNEEHVNEAIGYVIKDNSIIIQHDQAYQIMLYKGADKFEKGKTYIITNRYSAASNGTGTTGVISLVAVGDYELSSSGQFYVGVPDYTNVKVWSNTNTASEVIHLGKTWTFQTGGVLTDEPILHSTSWMVKAIFNVDGSSVTDTNGNSIYENNEIVYILPEDWISERKDMRGNVVSNPITKFYQPGYTTPLTINQFPWGNVNIYDNNIVDSDLGESFLRGTIKPDISNNTIKGATFVGIAGTIAPTDPTKIIGLEIKSCTIIDSRIHDTTFAQFHSLVMNGYNISYCNFLNCNNSVLSGLGMQNLGSPQFPCDFQNNNLTGADLQCPAVPTQATSFKNVIATGDIKIGLNENHENDILGYGIIKTIAYADALAIHTYKSPTNKFIKGVCYRITNRVLQGTGTTGDVLVVAVDDYELSTTGQIRVGVPDYAGATAVVWKTGNTASVVIHLGKTWEFAPNGNLADEPMVVPTSWTPATNADVYSTLPDANGNLIYEWDEVHYTLSNDWISERKDKRGNIVSISASKGLDYGITSPITIDQFPWGNNNIYSNTVSDSDLGETFLRGVAKPYIIGNQINNSSFIGVIGFGVSATQTGITGLDMELCTINYSTFQSVTGKLGSATIINSTVFNCNFDSFLGCELNSSSVNGLGLPAFPCTFKNNVLTGAIVSSTIAPTMKTTFNGVLATGSLNMGLNENHSNESIGYTTTSKTSDTQNSLAPLYARFLDGSSIAYNTVQLAADALSVAGGGTIYSQVDMIGPLVLNGNISLIAPGRRLYNDTNIELDVLTLSYCYGTTIELAEVSKTANGWGYPINVSGGNITLKTNITCTRGYNALFISSGVVNFTGNVDFTYDPFKVGGERIAVLAYGGSSLKMTGNITVNSVDTNTEGITSYGVSDIQYNGIINITNKGLIARVQGSDLLLRGSAISNDKGIKVFDARANIYMSIDTRLATNPTSDNAPIRIYLNAGANGTEYITLHSGSELLAPATVPSMILANGTSATVGYTGTLLQTALPGTGITLQQLTLGSSTASNTNELALKANITSPTFTGIPAAPTATAGTSTTQLATTEFVTTSDINLQTQITSNTNKLVLKADLVSGIVPYIQLPTGTLMLKQLNGNYSYFTTYENAINAAGAGDTIYFGPGTFGSATVSVHLQKTISLVLDPGTTWLFQFLFLQTYPNTGDRVYVINGQGGGKIVGIVRFNDGSQTAAITLANLRHEGNVQHTSYLAGFNNSPAKIKFEQVRSIAATGDYMTVGMRNGGFYYKPLIIESYNSFHSVTAGSFLNNAVSDGAAGAGQEPSVFRMYRSTIKCPDTTPLFINADTAFVYDFSLVAYLGIMNPNIVNGTTYLFAGSPSGTNTIHRTTTTLTFDRDAEYDPISSGTFTVNDAGKTIGAVVSAYLNPSATAPTIPTTGYRLISGSYVAGKTLMYMFKVGANNQIQYSITDIS